MRRHTNNRGFICALTIAMVSLGLPARGWGQTDAGVAAAGRQAAAQRDGQHDFDFEFGSWNVHLRRRLRPLTGSDTWVDLEGTSIVQKVWDGRANLGELKVSNATTHVEGLSLRLYNPQTRQWNIYWSNANDGSLGTP